jgi:3-isopropylmalate dehydrogenase
MERATIAVFPGDGIGPEVTTQARAVLALCAERFDLQLEFVAGLIGGGAIDRDGTALPDASLALAKRSDAVLLGAVGGPKWDNPQSKVRPEQALLGLRRSLELFANLRPIVAHPALIDAAPLKREGSRGSDILFVRELTGGVYSASRASGARGQNHGGDRYDTLSEGEVARVTRLLSASQQRRKHVTRWTRRISWDLPMVEVTREIALSFRRGRVRRCDGDAPAAPPARFRRRHREHVRRFSARKPAPPARSACCPRRRSARRSTGHGGRVGLCEPIHGSAPDIADATRQPARRHSAWALLLEFAAS